MKSSAIIKYFSSVITIIVGVVFCFSVNAGVQALSVIAGAILIFAGALGAVGEIIKEKSLASKSCVWSAFSISFGIIFIEANLNVYIYYFIAYSLIVVGAMYLFDAFLAFFVRKEPLAMAVFAAAIGAAAISVGVCLKTVNGFAEFCSLALGIVIIIYGAFNLLSSLIAVFKSQKESDGIKEVGSAPADEDSAKVEVKDVIE